MKNMIWKRLIAVGCAASLFITAPGVTVLATEVEEEMSTVESMLEEEDLANTTTSDIGYSEDDVPIESVIEDEDLSFEADKATEDQSDTDTDNEQCEDLYLDENPDDVIFEDAFDDNEEDLIGSTASQAISLDDAYYYASLVESAEVRNCFYSLFDEFPPHQGGGTKIYNQVSGSYWTNKINDNIWSGSKCGGAWQCFGFALYCYATMFHCLGTDVNTSDSAMLLQGATSASYDSFRNAGVKPGAHIRCVSSENKGHSMIVLYYDSDCIVVYHANGDGKGTVYAGKYTWSQFNSAQLGGHSPARHIRYVAVPYNYPIPDPPSDLWINTNKKNYRIGETVEFSFGSKNASTLAIPIDVNGRREFFNYVNGQNSYSQSFDVPGQYGYFLYGTNSAGDASSEYGEFYVYNEKPKDLSIWLDKKEFAVGEEVRFSFSSKYAGRLAIPIDVNGKREFFNIVTDQTSYAQSFNTPGVYGYFLYAENDYGEVSTEYDEFYVYNEKPKDFSISTDKEEYAVGEEVEFTFSSKYAKTLAIPIDVNGKREFFNHVDGKTIYTQSFDVPGTYGYFLYGTNDYGEESSEYKSFTVTAELPEDLTISTDKNEYAVGEEVKFTFGSRNANILAIPIDVNGKREFFNHVEGSTTYTQSFSVPGTYGYYLYGKNDYGEASSEYKEFYVYNEKPKDLSLSIDKEKYAVGEEVEFTFSSKYAKTLAIPIDVNGKREFFNHVEGNTTYTQSFYTLGQYGYFLHATNEYGESSTEYEEFYVYDSLDMKNGKTTVSLSQQSYTYDGSSKEPAVIVKQGDTELKKGTDYVVNYSNNTNAGTATVIIIGKGNYTGNISKTFAIYRHSVDNATVTGVVNKTYSGVAQTQNPTVKVGDRTLVNGTDYILSYDNNTDVGTATVTVIGKGNYAGSASKTFTISALSLSNATVTGIVNKTFTGSAQTQSPTVKVNDKTLASGTDYTLSYAGNTNAGTATVTITGKGNYTGNTSKTFTISAFSLSNATVTGIANKTYNGSDNGSAQTQNPTVKVGDKTLANGTDYTLSYKNNTNVGTATVTITGKGNYTGSVSKTFTIGSISIKNATVTGISNKTYNGSAQTQNPTVKVGDKTLVNGTDYTLSYSNNVNAGTATVTITGKGSYAESVSKTFTIQRLGADTEPDGEGR